MAPFKSSLAKSAGKLFGVFDQQDLSLRGATQTSRYRSTEITATGGSTFTAGGRTVHKFTSNQNFAITTGASNNVEVLVIGGGGAGGGDSGGGGGAGAVLYGTGISYGPGTYAVVVGDGGGATPTYYSDPESDFRNAHCGKDSTVAHPAGTFTGGGGNCGGMTYPSPYAQSPISDGNAGALGSNGGSNVGAPTSPATIPNAALTSPYPTPSEGTINVYRNQGGSVTSPNGSQWLGGGGGGAGGAGSAGVGGAGNGGNGYDAGSNISWMPNSEGVSGLFAGGGGAGSPDNGSSSGGGGGGPGGGGGGGAEGGGSNFGAAGGTNTGGGGGGSDGFAGAAGGSGIVYIAYPT
tara:strand:+ start:131 stop:1177 length:1047 start_codon:yes stop_codon:yes gene_type:complete